jgi:hypothetical protein
MLAQLQVQPQTFPAQVLGSSSAKENSAGHLSAALSHTARSKVLIIDLLSTLYVCQAVDY